MNKKEFKAVTKEWLFSKGFNKRDEFTYLLELQDKKFNVFVHFIHDRFSEHYYFDVGFELKGIQFGSGWVRVAITDKGKWKHIEMADGSKNIVKGNFYYTEWEKNEYLEELDKIYNIYISPYFEEDIAHWKKILKRRYYFGQIYSIGYSAERAILKG